MIKLINQDFESLELRILLANQGDDGASKQMQRVLEEEEQREETLNEMRSDEISISTPAQIEEIKAAEDDVSIDVILGLIERGLSDDEIAVAIEKSLISMADNIAKDKASIKRKLEKLQELLALLEVKARKNGIEPAKIVPLRDMQLHISRIRNNIENPNIGVQQVQALLKSSEIAKLVTVGIKQAQVAITLQNEIASRAKISQADVSVRNKPVQIEKPALANKNVTAQQPVSVQAILRESFRLTQQAYKAVKSDVATQTSQAPQTRIALQELSRQATAITTVVQNIGRESTQIQVLQKVADVLQHNTQMLAMMSKMVNAPAQQALADLGKSNKAAIQEVIQQIQKAQVVQLKEANQPQAVSKEVVKKDNVIPIAVKEMPNRTAEKIVPQKAEPVRKDNVMQFQPRERVELKPISTQPPKIEKPEIFERAPLGKVDKVATTGHPAGCGCPACVGAAQAENRDAKMAPATKVDAVERTRAPMSKIDKVATTGHPDGCTCPVCAGAASVENTRPSMQTSNAGRERQPAPQPTTAPSAPTIQEPLQEQAAQQSNQL